MTLNKKAYKTVSAVFIDTRLFPEYLLCTTTQVLDIKHSKRQTISCVCKVWILLESDPESVNKPVRESQMK